jgi:hypothetical protein
VCDGNQLNGQNCVSQGYQGGMLACNALCTMFNTAGCNNNCGNGVLNAGETCDGNELDDETCATQGFGGGNLTCNASCTMFNTDACCVNGGQPCDDNSDCCSNNCNGGSDTCMGS